MKLLIALLVLTFEASALTTGTDAPAFVLPGIEGKVDLKELRGKTIVLEWLNHGCPFVRKHYDSGNMQELQKKYTKQGIVWLSIISSAENKQGYVTPEESKAEKLKYKSHASNILFDTKGEVGKKYGAKTTPHMYIIDKEGKLVYQGAIDNKPDTDLLSIKSARNYVSEALEKLQKGEKIVAHTTRAYGCSVKYLE